MNGFAKFADREPRVILLISPNLAGSAPMPKTIGIVDVSALAASAAAVLFTPAITATGRPKARPPTLEADQVEPPPIDIRS